MKGGSSGHGATGNPLPAQITAPNWALLGWGCPPPAWEGEQGTFTPGFGEEQLAGPDGSGGSACVPCVHHVPQFALMQLVWDQRVPLRSSLDVPAFPVFRGLRLQSAFLCPAAGWPLAGCRGVPGPVAEREGGGNGTAFRWQ